MPTTTVTGTNVLANDITRRTGTAPVPLGIQAQVRAGSTSNTLAALDRTRAAGRASPATRTAIGTQSAQAAVQAATRANNAAAGTAAGAGIGVVTANGRGNPVSSTGARASTGQAATAAQVQQAARGTGSAAMAAQAGQTAVQGTMTRTNFATPAGRR